MKPPDRRLQARRNGLALLLPMALATGHAADEPRSLRDPTLPPFSTAASAPAAASAAPAAAASSARADGSARLPQHIVVVDGKHYVVDGGRRRGVGDAFGSARIERIEDSAVWVREGAALRRLPMYGQAVKRSTGAEPAPKAPPTAAPALATDDAAVRRRNSTLSRNSLPGDPS